MRITSGQASRRRLTHGASLQERWRGIKQQQHDSSPAVVSILLHSRAARSQPLAYKQSLRVAATCASAPSRRCCCKETARTWVSGQQKYSASCARRLARPPRPAGPSGALACAIAASSACLRANAASADRPGCRRSMYNAILLLNQTINPNTVMNTRLACTGKKSTKHLVGFGDYLLLDSESF